LQYLQPSDLSGAYLDAQQNARRNWLKYDEIERLMAGEIRSDLPANMPKVNDNTLAATIRKIPKRLFSRPMTGVVKAVDRNENWVGVLANVILTQRIIPNANTDASFLRKWKQAVKNSKGYGSQPIYTFFTQHGTYTGADFSLPYVRNVYLEPGKISDLASDYIFMDSFYTKLQLKRLLDKALEDANEVEAGNLDKADVIWDAKVLQAIYDAGPGGKDAQNMNPNERTGNNRAEKGLYKLTTCFNRGYKAPFYTFAPHMANEVAGTQYNTNPTGDLPIIYLYDEEDLINPYGKGLVESAGPTQNVLDNLTQTDVLSTQIGAQPPIDIHGDRSQTRLGSLEYSPRAYWFTGNATVTPVIHQNPQFYNALPSRMGLYKSQLQFQTGTFDNSVSSQDGNPGFSKTDAGVNSLNKQTDADDNDTLQAVSDAYARVVKSMLNIHMNNMEGSEMLALEGDQLMQLAKTDLVPTDEDGNPDINEIEVVWDNVRGTFDFEVDPMSSMINNDQQDAQNIQNALSTITLPVSYYMGQDGWKFNMGEAYRSLLMKMNIQNIDKILTKMTPEEAKAAKDAPFPVVDPPQFRVNSADIPAEYIPGLMQNGGVTKSDQPSSPSYSDQAKLMTAKVSAIQAQTQATQGLTGAIQGRQSAVQAQQDSEQQAAQAAQQQQSDQSQATPVQSSQDAIAQMSGPSPDEAEPSQQPMAHPDPQQRLMEIQQQYECDPQTAMTIMAAQDHGVTDEQLPAVLKFMAGRP
jgi:hypothetical protein